MEFGSMILQRFRAWLIITKSIKARTKSDLVIGFMNFMIFAYQQIPGFKFFFL